MAKTKKELIEKIKAVIDDYGIFTCADVYADSSPILGTLGRNTCQLAETFLQHKVEAVTYVNEQDTDSDYIAYEDLKLDVLKEIYELALKWEEENAE